MAWCGRESAVPADAGGVPQESGDDGDGGYPEVPEWARVSGAAGSEGRSGGCCAPGGRREGYPGLKAEAAAESKRGKRG